MIYMNTLETAIVWTLVFLIMTGAVFLGIKTAQVTISQIRNYENNEKETSPAEITRIVEVIYETIDEI